MRRNNTVAAVVVCAICSQEFGIPAWRQRRGDVKYCSKTCLAASQSKSTQQACETCNITFAVRPSRTTRGKGKYCSLECRRASGRYNPSVQRTCKWCGQSFKSFASTVARWPAEECQECWHSKFRTTRDRNGWEYRAWRAAVYRRDNYICRLCGIPGGKLHAHHIELWSRCPELRFEVSNGLTLHEECHRALHIEQKTGFFS
jgi:hypothetical protein